MEKQKMPLLRRIRGLKKKLKSFEIYLMYKNYPWYEKLLDSLARTDIWLSRPANQEEVSFEIYQIQQWQQHQHLLDIGKCDNTCDDWLKCSEDWKSGEEWAKIFGKNLKGKRNVRV